MSVHVHTHFFYSPVPDRSTNEPLENCVLRLSCPVIPVMWNNRLTIDCRTKWKQDSTFGTDW
jgi:hypothetical protein